MLSETPAADQALRLLAASQDLFGALDPAGELLWCNPAWTAQFGARAEGIARQVPAVGPGGHADVEVEIEDRWYAFSVTGDAAEPVRYLVGRDVSARYLDAFDGAPVGMTVTDLAGGYLRVNRAFAELSGYTEHELLNRGTHDILHPDDVVACDAASRSMLDGLRSTWTTELRYLHALGHLVYARLHVTLVRDHEGRPHHFSSQIEDITQSRRLLEALSLSVARYRTLVRNLPDTIITLFDHDLRYHLAEGAALSLQGMSEEDVIGRTPYDLLGPERGAQLAHQLRAALRGAPQSFEWTTDDGHVFATQAVPLLGEGGEIIGGMSVGRDVTLLKVAEAQREAHTSELERSNTELEQFAYVASHDLSEPLRMITSYLQLIQRRYSGQLDDDADEFIEFAVDGAARMRRLIDDLLAYSRVGRKERPFEAIDVAALVEQVTSTLPAAADEEDDIVLEVGDLPAVHGDPTQLSQLFQNLIGNAVKFVPAERTARVRVLAAPEPDGPLWRFSIADNGIGIDPRYADRVFRMFQRLHTREEYEGTGIGLAIAKKVVERHGGRIWLEPEPVDGGTCFHFTLPLADPAVAP